MVTKEGTTGFCHCGVSENKPFCDGLHRKIE
ncbi:CDGSH iron-sulfur domain-containing protein [Maribacter aquivivus]|nr:CDGSH iron-sulfur domain-containing protein [Maribacter aquivivus]